MAAPVFPVQGGQVGDAGDGVRRLCPHVHARAGENQLAVYWVIGTGSFDRHGDFSLSSQSYVSPQHEDLEMSAMAAEGLRSQDGGNGRVIIMFTLNGNGGPTGQTTGASPALPTAA